MKLLYFAPHTFGGMADYAREQAAALARRGVEVDVLCAPSFASSPHAPVRRIERLAESKANVEKRGRLGRMWRFVTLTVGQHRELARTVRSGGYRHVLLASYAEYFAPLWSPALRKLADAGVVFGAVVHDPVRDHVVGPPSWHRRSVADAYSFLRHAFVHEAIELDTVRPMPRLRTTVIPHGPYMISAAVPERAAARAQLNIPADAPVLLAFGHIRDGKNLDLNIRALAALPKLHLIVAGKEQSSGQRSGDSYRALARELGVDARCHWAVRFIPETEVGLFFAAADFMSLSYSRSFRSASGVLNASVMFRKPCIASSGDGPLRTAIEKYGLGIWVEPDQPDALVDGLRRLLLNGTRARWDDYISENSWERNAELVSEAFLQSAA
jgi:glycosyltransferase involved in cell wall biosynthesis